ncbi:MAG: hypothetical protein SCALA702_21480 [Melioribacteraceae bacterium]|nr:MAG: hypothetical protein SCALA702_21480 [Melioribacteraceae bacterium]
MLSRSTFLLLLFISSIIFAQNPPPKDEFRAAWIATVVNLDWPTNPHLSTEEQKSQIIYLFDELKKLNFNAVVFQVRSECDAFYNSSYEPWSYYMTGVQGQGPAPFYDPLEFAVEEAHKRGIEFHAWFNPYRADRGAGYPKHSSHVTITHPEWTIQSGSLKILNPGMAEVREYVVDVIMDVVNRYDIDGVHFDDYFYPYEGISNQDWSTFQAEPRGFSDINSWRRDNVNIFVDSVYTNIKEVKPHVKFGVSPFGIWKSGYPAGVSGLSSYYSLYCDPMNWMQRGKLDYLTPQLYWRHGGNQDYGSLMNWWADSVSVYDKHFYPGHAAYRIPDFPDISEIQRQMRANRANATAGGSVFFRARAGVLDNEKGFTDSLRNDLYRNPAVPPTMNWLDGIAPNAVQNLVTGLSPEVGLGALVWDIPQPASDGDTAFFYGVYRFDTPTINPSDLENTDNFEMLTGQKHFNLLANNQGSTQYFVVTAFDRNFNESVISNVIEVAAPEAPPLEFPANGADDIAKDVELKWNYKHITSQYTLEISDEDSFPAGNTLVWENITDTTYQPLVLEGERTYYWRVKGYNPAGESEYSDVFSFTTGYPAEPILLYPEHASTDLSVNPELVWAKKESATSYRIQVGINKYFDEPSVAFDTVVVGDTSVIATGLDYFRVYWWRVSGINDLGSGQWSEAFGFKTEQLTSLEEENIPSDYSLSQNYPNPFNPLTKIRFSLPEQSMVTLKVYDILGREVATLLDGVKSAGTHTVSFNASALSSGIYIYRISTPEFSSQKKLILMK